MKRTFTILIASIFTLTMSYSQIDQVSVGSGYSQQAYYNLSTGESAVVANDAWDIAFSAIGQQDAGIFVNESVSFMGSPVYVYRSGASDWSESITKTSEFIAVNTLYNPEENWTDGAINSIKDPSNPFDYGWGTYNPAINIVEGSEIFIFQKRDGSYIKFQIQNLTGGTYNWRYAALDGSNEKSHSISKTDVDGSLIHFSFDTDGVVDMPVDYDLIFQRYSTMLDAGDGSFIPYTVTGVLLANGVEAVRIEGVDPTDVVQTDYEDQYSTLPTTIGHDWKFFDFTTGWGVLEDRTHFVKTAAGDIYQVTFFDFEGSSTGVSTLRKTIITSVSTEDESLQAVLKVYPNPTIDNFSIDFEGREIAVVSICNNSGQLVKKAKISAKSKIDVSNFDAGIYNILINIEGKVLAKRLIIK